MTFYLAVTAQGAKDSLDVFKGAPDTTLGSVGGLRPRERCLGGEHSTLGLIWTQHLMVRGLRTGGGPLPLAPGRAPRQSSHREASRLAGLSPITAHAKITVWEPGPARPRPSISQVNSLPVSPPPPQLADILLRRGWL